MPRSLALTIFALTAGCATNEGVQYAQVLPDERVEIRFPDTSTAARSTDGYANWYLFTHEVTRDVNGMAGWFLHVAHDIVHTPPSSLDTANHRAEWGPYSRTLDPVESLLWVEYAPETDTYTWGVDQWPKSDESAKVTVLEGEVDAGATHKASSGRYTVDFTAIHDLDPTSEVSGGTFTVDYVITPDEVSGTAGFSRFGDNKTDASYAYDQVDGEGGTMDLAVWADLNGNDTEELLLVRSRWTDTGAGRSDVIGTLGDLGTSDVTVNQCWDSSFHEVWYTDNYGGEEVGDEADCAFADAEYTDLTLE